MLTLLIQLIFGQCLPFYLIKHIFRKSNLPFTVEEKLLLILQSLRISKFCKIHLKLVFLTSFFQILDRMKTRRYNAVGSNLRLFVFLRYANEEELAIAERSEIDYAMKNYKFVAFQADCIEP